MLLAVLPESMVFEPLIPYWVSSLAVVAAQLGTAQTVDQLVRVGRPATGALAALAFGVLFSYWGFAPLWAITSCSICWPLIYLSAWHAGRWIRGWRRGLDRPDDVGGCN